jgi:hypothetical protein
MASKGSDGEDGLRQAERLSVDAPARLRPNSWSSIEVRLIDLSESGFRARCEARVQVGSCVSLDVAGIGPVDAQVEWQRSGTFGARFLVPIDLHNCGWTGEARGPVLAELLFQRAAAKKAGRDQAEKQIRSRIGRTLPMAASGGSAR